MEEVFNRDKDGKVNFAGVGTSTIPQGKLALSMFADNPFIADCEYKDDGWIYTKSGEKIRKWFIKVDGVTVWEPILSDPAKLEQRYTEVRVGLDAVYKEWGAAFDEVRRVGVADAKPTHKYELYENHTWRHYSATQEGITFDWMDEPAEPKNVEIGTRYYNVTQRLEVVGGRISKFTAALTRSLELKIPKDIPRYMNMIDFKINGKTYWLKLEKSKYSRHWRLFAYPGSTNHYSVEI